MKTSAVVGLVLTSALLSVPAVGDRGDANARTDRDSSLRDATIVFARGSDLYVASRDGSEMRRLARDGGQPDVSPEGRRIVFVRKRSIWVMNRDGTGQRRLTAGRDAIGPAWSPDGTTIYFSGYILKKDARGQFLGYAWAIFRMRANGRGARKLTHPEPTDHGTCHAGPAPSPDGRVIAFSIVDDCDHGFDPGITAIDPDGRTVNPNRFNNRSGFDPTWSPDGRRLAFASESGIEVASSDGADRPRPVYRRGPASGPAWSPDGKWLAFSTDGQLWAVRSDASSLRRIVKTGVWRSDPAWLPAAP